MHALEIIIRRNAQAAGRAAAQAVEDGDFETFDVIQLGQVEAGASKGAGYPEAYFAERQAHREAYGPKPSGGRR